MRPWYRVIGTPKYSYICGPLVNRMERVRLIVLYLTAAIARERTGINFMGVPFISISDCCKSECTHFGELPPLLPRYDLWCYLSHRSYCAGIRSIRHA